MSEGCEPAGQLLAIVLAALPMFAARRARQSAPASDITPEPQDGQTIGVDRMVRLLDETLQLARGAAATRAREPVDVHALLATLVQERNSERLKLIAADSSVHALADAAALGEMLRILIDNGLAQTAFASPAQVILRLDHGTSALVVHVDDNGPGIPRALRAAAFDPAPLLAAVPQRLGAPSPSLASAQKIARAFGGGITISSSPEGGARLTVQLPLLGAHEIELAAAS